MPSLRVKVILKGNLSFLSFPHCICLLMQTACNYQNEIEKGHLFGQFAIWNLQKREFLALISISLIGTIGPTCAAAYIALKLRLGKIVKPPMQIKICYHHHHQHHHHCHHHYNHKIRISGIHIMMMLSSAHQLCLAAWKTLKDKCIPN